jgi:CheY-like chemotaxis protein
MKPKPIRILVADDDEDDRLNMKHAFARTGLEIDVQFVTDGAELLDYLGQKGAYVGAERPGLILLDLNMPRMDGREALRVIKDDPSLRSIPVVVLTTSREDEDILRSYDLGASSFITKPMSFDALVNIVTELKSYWFRLVQLPPGSDTTG